MKQNIRDGSKMQKTLITVSIPIYNEERNIKRLVSRLQKVAEIESKYEFEFLFTDNASTDDGFSLLNGLAQSETRIRVLRFSRNFGFQKSILTNYLNAKGKAAIQLDADMQDPPEMISDFLRKWEEGYKVVYGIRRRRKENPLLHLVRRIYYWLVDSLTQYPVPKNAGDFRLIDDIILKELRHTTEQTPYLRGMISSFGYAQIGIPYDRDIRRAGSSKFSFLQLVEIGIDGITAQSIRPLRIVTIFGVLLSISSTLAILYYLMASYFYFDTIPSGFTTIVLLLLFLIGLNAFLLGLLGEYIGRIFNNTRGLPSTIIQDSIEPLRVKKRSSKR